MPRWVRVLIRLVVVIVALAAVLGGALWWKLRPRVEAIPDQLAAAPTATAVSELRVPGSNGAPDLELSTLRGQTVLLLVEGKDSMESGEGRETMNALNRWELPEQVSGYFIAELEGLGLLSFKLDQVLGFIASESRFPVYADYKGAILRGFELPKGHSGVVVLDAAGGVAFRHSGSADADRLASLREALGATEPEPLAPPGPFSVGLLSNDSCRGSSCAFAFLAEPVKRSAVPGIEGGFDGDRTAAAAQFGNASIRLVASLAKQELPGEAPRGALLGDLADVPLANGWTTLPDDPAARHRFGVPAAAAALVIVDAEGQLVFRELGLVPLYKLLYARELLGLE